MLTDFQRNPIYNIVTISGGEVNWNVLRSSDSFCSYKEENKESAIAVADGDLIYVFTDSEIPLIFRYKIEDGLHLSFTTDTIGLIKNNNKVISLSIEEDSNIWEWIEKNERSAFENLRSLQISLPISDTNLSYLKKISEINPDIGLFIENMDSERIVKEIFSLFNLQWLVFADNEIEDISDQLFSNLTNLELLIIDGDINLDFLYDLPRLRSLVLESWDPEINKNFKFKNLKNLKTLNITNSGVKDLSLTGELLNLQSLNLTGCDSLEDINLLSKFSKLKSLSFIACNKISNILIINEIPSLTWLSFPPNIRQEEFSDIINHHNSLQVIELIECEKINDLSPLNELNEIKTIALDVPATDFTPLYQLKTLELIIIEEDKFNESESDIYNLRDALPEAKVIPGGGFCLGSGWLLLLFPIIILIRLIYLLKRID